MDQGPAKPRKPAPRGRAVTLRLTLAEGVALGPGKADLLEAIGAAGSIAAAGRRLGMSYQRAHDLVAALNADFGGPVVTTAMGGAGGGGARLTPLGEAVLAAYREALAAAEAAVAAPRDRLRALRAKGG
jgi:molybdate transport system regulatory protein